MLCNRSNRACPPMDGLRPLNMRNEQLNAGHLHPGKNISRVCGKIVIIGIL